MATAPNYAKPFCNLHTYIGHLLKPCRLQCSITARNYGPNLITKCSQIVKIIYIRREKDGVNAVKHRKGETGDKVIILHWKYHVVTWDHDTLRRGKSICYKNNPRNLCVFIIATNLCKKRQDRYSIPCTALTQDVARTEGSLSKAGFLLHPPRWVNEASSPTSKMSHRKQNKRGGK